MAETLISPGVLARENDQSQVTSQPIQAGACIVGPTVLGRVNIPKLVTTYSEYLANFGSTFSSGSDTFTYFTSISAYNYFNNGGTSLIVNRVASGSWTPAVTTTDPIRNNEESTKLTPAPFNFTGSAGITARGGTAGAFTGVFIRKNASAANSTTSVNMTRGTAIGKLFNGTGNLVGNASSIANRFNTGTNPITCLPGLTKTDVILVGGNNDARATVKIGVELGSTQRGTITELQVTNLGTNYTSGTVLTIGAGGLGSGMLKVGMNRTATSSNTVGTVAANTQVMTDGTPGAGTNTFAVTDGTAASQGEAGATLLATFNKTAGKLITSTTGAVSGDAATGTSNYAQTAGVTFNIPTGAATGASGGRVTLVVDANGTVTTATFTQTSLDGTNSALYANGNSITLTETQLLAGGLIKSGGFTGGSLVIAVVGATNILTEIVSITPNPGSTVKEGFKVGNIITIPDGSITGLTGANTIFTLQAADVEDSGVATATALTVNAASAQDAGDNNLTIEPTSITLNTQGASDTFAVSNTLNIPTGGDGTTAIGAPDTPLVVTLQNADILDAEAFTLETLSDGTIMNSGIATGANGTLTAGTTDNIRWEIQATDVATGTFSLIIRQGNDTATSKRILEIFPNVSLDPKQSNYVGRIVGDMKKVFNGAGTTDPYISTVGSYPNASRYVRVSNVAYKTPDYFDNNGAANATFASYLPDVGSGSFAGAEGELFSRTGFPTYTRALYYDAISDANTQGLTSTEMSVYTDAFNLLANKDDYSYNIITSPGLYYASSMMATPMNVLVQNTATRGDAIAILDVVNYSGGTVVTAKSEAAKIDNSYAATYWPWVQLSDPDSSQLVWTVPSSVIPGVYAFNDRTSEAWFAPAGINRGGLNTVVQAQRKLTQTNRDDLYTGKVNPIATFPGKGVVVFGQKTLQSQASALDRINVRRLLIALKSFIVQIADNLVFEQNTAATRNNFLSQVNPYMESVQQRQGLYAFKVVMDSTNNGPDVVDRNQMVGAIYVQPTKTAEFIYLDFNILPTGATFPS